MWELVKGYIQKWQDRVLWVIGGLLVAFLFFHSCSNHNIPISTVLPVEPTKPSAEDISNYGAKEVIPVKEIPKKIGYTTKTEVIVTKENKYIQVTKQKLDWGLANKLGLSLSANLGTLDLGLVYRGPFVWRVGLDALLGLKTVGLGASYRVLDNTNLGIAYQYNYSNLMPSPAVYLSIGF